VFAPHEKAVSMSNAAIDDQVRRRRTFAIISHPHLGL